MATPVYFTTGTSKSRAPAVTGERLVNGFVERNPAEAESQAPIFGSPGLQAFATPTGGAGPARGRWLFNGMAYFVLGTELWSVSSSGVATLVGNGIGGVDSVVMSDNGIQLIVVNGGGPGGAGWTYTVAGGLVQITDPNFFAADYVLFMDGYFILNRSGTNEWFLSALYDGTTYNGLDFATAEAGTEPITGFAENLQLLFIFCQKHIEIWYDSGALSFPFDRYAGGVIPYGCSSPDTITLQDGALFFLGTDKTFYRLQANVPIRISTHAMETIIASEPDITQAYVDTYTEEGHKFIVLTLPGAGKTIKFDISVGKWHERESWDANNASLGIWRACRILEAYQKVLCGDAFSSQIGQIMPIKGGVYTEYGNTLRLLAVSAPLQHGRSRIFLPDFELHVQAGVGLTIGQGADPQCMLRKSKDGGEKWSPYQKWRSMGMIGQTTRRLRWLRNGQARQWTLEVSITDPVFRCIVAAYAETYAGL